MHDAYSQLMARGFGTCTRCTSSTRNPGAKLSRAISFSILAESSPLDCRSCRQTGQPMHVRLSHDDLWCGRTVEMGGMEPNESRGVLFRSAQSKVGKVQVLYYDAKAARRPVTVKLEPYATVKGRLLDEEGMPLKFVNVGVVALGNNYVLPPWRNGVESQADGRFVVSNVAAGAEYYEVLADGFDEPIAKKLSISAAQTIDLGDIRRKRKDNHVSSSKPDQTLKAAPPSKKTTAAEVNGDPWPRAVARRQTGGWGPRLALRDYWAAFTKRRPLGKAIAGRDGRFAISLPKNQSYGGWANTGGGTWIAAAADGFGRSVNRGILAENIQGSGAETRARVAHSWANRRSGRQTRSQRVGAGGNAGSAASRNGSVAVGREVGEAVRHALAPEGV